MMMSKDVKMVAIAVKNDGRLLAFCLFQVRWYTVTEFYVFAEEAKADCVASFTTILHYM